MADDFSILRLDVDETAVRALLDALGVELPDTERRERDLGDESDTETRRARDRTGPRVGETPPPGAGDEVSVVGDDDTDESEGWDRRLLAGAGAAVLALVVGVAAVLYRRRSDGELPIPDVDLPGGSTEADSSTEDAADDGTAPEDRPESAIDTAPLIGIALLAAGNAVARAVQSERE